MRVTTVFNKLLAVQGAFVRGVAFGSAQIVVDVVKRHRRHRCPRCAFSTRARYDRDVREWRHISLGKWRIVLRAVLCRLECPEHGVVTEAVPWAEHDSRFTRDFEDLVALGGPRDEQDRGEEPAPHRLGHGRQHHRAGGGAEDRQGPSRAAVPHRASTR